MMADLSDWLHRRSTGRVTLIAFVGFPLLTPQSLWQRANLVPVMGTFFDYVDNGAAALVIGRYPARSPVVEVLAPVCTFVKWIFVGGSFVLLTVALVAALWRQAKTRR